ncbi:MAG TPA: ECF-type sigma factor [Verrucomicrobiae bacterium]|nr:ECF-type sigma factor [Verrucomicrobiae bacterium]
MTSDASLTERLNLFLQGNQSAADALLREVLPKLHEIAARELKRERYLAPLSKTELIHEVWLSNLSKGGWQIHDRGHFYALASLAMRRVLVDLARKRLAARRGAGEPAVELDESMPLLGPMRDAEEIVEIGILMDRLEEKDPDAARMVDMHYFSGFTLEEVARETGLTFRQVRSRWERGLKWLKKMLANRPRTGTTGQGR